MINCTKFDFHIRPERAYSTPPDSRAGFDRDLVIREGRKGMEMEERKGEEERRNFAV